MIARMSWSEPRGPHEPTREVVGDKEHMRVRKRMRKLELLLLRFIELEAMFAGAKSDAHADKIADKINNHCALVRRMLFR